MRLIVSAAVVGLSGNAAFFDAIIKSKGTTCFTEEMAAHALFVAEVAPRGTEMIKVSLCEINPTG